MAKVLLKKSSVGDNAPGVDDLSYGEVAINYADGRLYYKNSSNQIKNFVDSDLLDATYIRSVFDDPAPALSADLEIDSRRITNATYGPGSYIGLQEYYTGDSAQQLVIASREDVNIIVDTNNGSFGGSFNVLANDSDVNNATTIFSVDETGTITAYGNINFSNASRITNLSTPIGDADATTKLYVDNAIADGVGSINFPVGDWGKVDSAAHVDAFGISYTNAFWDMLTNPENDLPVVDFNT